MALEILDCIKKAEAQAKQTVDEATAQAAQLVATARKSAADHSDYIIHKCQEEAALRKADTKKTVEQEKVEFDEQTKKKCDELREKLSAQKDKAAEAIIHLVMDGST